MFIDSKEVVRVSVNGFTFACMHAKLVNRIRLFVTPWTVVCQTPLSIEFSRQEYWSGLPCPPLGDHLDPGMEPLLLVTPAAPLVLASLWFCNPMIAPGGVLPLVLSR